MKNVIYLLLLFSTCIYAQKKRVNLSKSTIGTISAEYTKSIDLEKNDTLYYVYCGFQNKKYSSISDIKSIFITKDEDLKSLIKDLKTAVNEMGVDKVNINWTRENYELVLYDFSNELYILEKPKKGSGYTTLSKKQVEEFIFWLEKIDFGKG